MKALFGLLMLFVATAPAWATGRFDPDRSLRFPSSHWDALERLDDPHPALRQERFLPLVAQSDPELIAAFGSATPRSSRALLHHAPAPAQPMTTPTTPTAPPVILIHGAGLTASSCFGDGPLGQSGPGLAARLTAAGLRVFALTFAHGHGDNYMQAELLADAIARVRRITGAAQVDLLAYSKGGMAARIYLASAGKAWATPYRGDVRRYVMLGTPNGGIDIVFAYPNLNYWMLERDWPAPVSWTRALYRGIWRDLSARSIYAGGCFPGQAQMLARWDLVVGRAWAHFQWDVDTTYDGGQGLVSRSLGIARAIREGGNAIAKLRLKALPAGLELAALAGTNPWILGQWGERRGSSDGLLLVASALELSPLAAGGAIILKSDLLPLNHFELVTRPEAADWAIEALR